MIIQLKNGTVFATGKVTSRGVETRVVGSTTKTTWGMVVDNYKDELGNWQKTFLNCAVWGNDIEAMPSFDAGDLLFVTGKNERRTWQGRDGEARTSEEARIDFVCLAAPSGAAAPVPFTPAAPKPVDVQASVFDQFNPDDDEDLPF